MREEPPLVTTLELCRRLVKVLQYKLERSLEAQKITTAVVH
jgi:hypothetical protein